MGNNGSSTYSQRLSPQQVQKILDELRIPWREYDRNSEGWFSIPGEEFCGLISAAGYDHMPFVEPSFNIKHGGYIDHWFNGLIKSRDDLDDFEEVYDEISEEFVDREKKSVKGDVVDLVKLLLFKNDQSKETTVQAIRWINNTLGIGGKPELLSNQIFAKNAIAKNEENYVMIPNSLWQNKSLSAGAKIVWIAIYDRCGKGKHHSFAGMEKIAEDTGLSRSTVQLRVQELIDKGFLIEIVRGEGRAPNRYPVVKLKNEYPTENR